MYMCRQKGQRTEKKSLQAWVHNLYVSLDITTAIKSKMTGWVKTEFISQIGSGGIF
jgi:hypothetical protein